MYLNVIFLSTPFNDVLLTQSVILCQAFMSLISDVDHKPINNINEIERSNMSWKCEN